LKIFLSEILDNRLRIILQKKILRSDKIYEIYKNLTLELQLSVVIETAYKIGTLDKFEIEENPPNEISLLEIDLINE
jgi:hypothetical protein